MVGCVTGVSWFFYLNIEFKVDCPVILLVEMGVVLESWLYIFYFNFQLFSMVGGAVWKPNELRQVLMPTLEKLYRLEPESLPFRQPVDPIQLGIPVSGSLLKRLIQGNKTDILSEVSSLLSYPQLAFLCRITLTLSKSQSTYRWSSASWTPVSTQNHGSMLRMFGWCSIMPGFIIAKHPKFTSIVPRLVDWFVHDIHCCLCFCLESCFWVLAFCGWFDDYLHFTAFRGVWSRDWWCHEVARFLLRQEVCLWSSGALLLWQDHVHDTHRCYLLHLSKQVSWYPSMEAISRYPLILPITSKQVIWHPPSETIAINTRRCYYFIY